jgi:hypothetical protein
VDVFNKDDAITPQNSRDAFEVLKLEMRAECLDCLTKLSTSSDAHICSYECTYCSECAEKRDFICKNCGGDLQKRPKRNDRGRPPRAANRLGKVLRGAASARPQPDASQAAALPRAISAGAVAPDSSLAATAAEIGQYAREGYTIRRGAFSAAECGAMREHYMKLRTVDFAGEVTPGEYGGIEGQDDPNLQFPRFHNMQDFDARSEVRKIPSWPRSWANFSLLWLYFYRNAWANLHILGQPNTFLAGGLGCGRPAARGGRRAAGRRAGAAPVHGLFQAARRPRPVLPPGPGASSLNTTHSKTY